ncbi:MAG TPA: glycosyltransferase [Puia sp.]
MESISGVAPITAHNRQIPTQNQPLKKIKILWFTNTASLAAGHLGMSTVGGGWIESLEERIKGYENVELAIAFNHGKKSIEKFTHDKTTYYTVPDKRSRIKTFTDRHLNSFNDDQLIGSCLEIINDFKPDIINIFGTEKGFGLISDKVDMPVVIHLQGILTVYEKKWFSAGIDKLTLFTRSDLKSLIKATTLLHNYRYFRKGALREQRIFEGCKYFMGRTDWDKRICAVLAPQAGYFTSNEILRKEFYLNTWNKKSTGKKIFISTIQPTIFKGLETVLECAILLKELNKFDFEWIIAGISGEDRIVKIFEKRAGKKFRDFNVTLTGKLKTEELLKRELNADIFIHPSHIDNSPNSVCEAMLIGMPVIATFTGGTGSMLTDKTEGILIQDGDPYAMAGAILELVKNPHYAAELGQNARDCAMKRHDPDEIVNTLIATYTQIMAAAH